MDQGRERGREEIGRERAAHGGGQGENGSGPGSALPIADPDRRAFPDSLQPGAPRKQTRFGKARQKMCQRSMTRATQSCADWPQGLGRR